MKVQFRNTITGRTETYGGLTHAQAVALVAFVDTLGDRATTELRVRTPAADRFGPVWADVTGEF